MFERPRFEFAEINRTVYGKYQDGSFYDCLCGIEQAYAHKAGALEGQVAAPETSRGGIRSMFARMTMALARPRPTKA